MAEGGRRANGSGRDAALTWDVPPALEGDEAGAAAAARPAFAAVAAKHLEALVRQLLQAEGVQAVDAWAPLLCELAGTAAAALSPTAAAAHGKLDPRHYIKVGAQGSACDANNILHRRKSTVVRPAVRDAHGQGRHPALSNARQRHAPPHAPGRCFALLAAVLQRIMSTCWHLHAYRSTRLLTLCCCRRSSGW